MPGATIEEHPTTRCIGASLPTVSIAARIAQELNAREAQVTAAIDLFDGGSTVPFVARYRKEATGGLDDTQLRTLDERLKYLREMEDRRAAILKSIEEQGKLTPQVREQIEAAESKARLEDLYLPFKPKRRTKAQIAREAGLEPLADLLLEDPTRAPEAEAAAFVDAEKGVADAKAALDGAMQILMERFAEDADLVGSLRDHVWSHGRLTSKLVEGKAEAGAKFSDYFDAAEAIAKIPSHRALALLRGRNEEILSLALVLDEEPKGKELGPCERRIAARFGIVDRNRPADAWLQEVVRWTWRVKLRLHIEVELMTRLRQQAETEAVRVFAANLKDILMAAPAGGRATIGLDPGLRTGVKVAVLAATGKVLETATIYPHEPQRRWDESIAILAALASRHQTELIAIGNGTASRETDRLAAELIKLHPQLKLTKIVVSEAGASVYSASEYASKELPALDVSLRGAVSIARRLQDPLAELVKIDPKSIGVGQYQHDVNQAQLSGALDAVVEDCVNAVGVDVNLASARLLARVSGLNDALAQNIVVHRDQNGPFRSRQALLKVARLGPKAFEQCAGFLRIRDGDDPLDSSSVHPESYPVVRRILAHLKSEIRAVIGDAGVLRSLKPEQFADEQVRRADRDRHPEGAGEAGPRPAPRVQDGQLQGRRGGDEGPHARHAAGRRRHQRRQFRRLRRHRRASGRAGARLRPGRPLREGSARSGEAGRHREGQGAGGRPQAQAHLPHHAPARRGRRPRRGAGQASGRPAAVAARAPAHGRQAWRRQGA